MKLNNTFVLLTNERGAKSLKTAGIPASNLHRNRRSILVSFEEAPADIEIGPGILSQINAEKNDTL